MRAFIGIVLTGFLMSSTAFAWCPNLDGAYSCPNPFGGDRTLLFTTQYSEDWVDYTIKEGWTIDAYRTDGLYDPSPTAIIRRRAFCATQDVLTVQWEHETTREPDGSFITYTNEIEYARGGSPLDPIRPLTITTVTRWRHSDGSSGVGGPTTLNCGPM